MRVKPRRRGIAFKIFALLVIIIIAIYAYSNMALTNSNYEVYSHGLPEQFDGFKIVVLSDLHGKQFGKNNAALINAVDKVNPDIIVLAGDMVTYDASDADVFYSLARTIAPKYETYYVFGNHEGQLSPSVQDEICARVTEYGVHILNNSSAKIEHDRQTIDIYGLDLPGYMYSSTDKNGDAKYAPTPEWIETALGVRPDDSEFSILIAHTPLYFGSYSAWGADLILSGHIHGGEVRIPFVGGVFSPHDEYFPKYDAGEFKIASSTMIVSRGLGEHAFPVRFLNPADLCIITLHTDDN